eukprot:2098413-Karenia_brevis.AAC.1
MPPCNTTPINDHNNPEFTITIYSPTKKHPNPQRPPLTIITATYTKLPTHTNLNINILEAIPLADGSQIRGEDLAATIRERFVTWANPFGAV